MPAAQANDTVVKPLMAGPVDTSARLESLRQVMKEHAVSAYIIPTEDPHQSEYIADCDKRRSWISGFTGSAGTAVVTSTLALLWTDGRYFLQASQQLDSNWTLMKSGIPDVPTKEEWLAKNLLPKSRIGFDPKLVSSSGVKALRDALRDVEATTIELAPLEENLVDKVWKDRPARPKEPVVALELKYTGKSSEDKIKDTRDEMAKKGVVALVVTALDEIAWLFNLRGADISYNPVFFSFALVELDNVYLYVDQGKISPEVVSRLSHVTIRPYDAIYADVHALGGNLAAAQSKSSEAPVEAQSSKPKTSKVWMDGRCNYALMTALGNDKLVEDSRLPVTMAKAIKNSTELEGFRQCHLRDGAALCNFIAWLEHELTVNKNTALTEWEAAQVLEGYRRQQSDFVGLSFDTISSTGPNAAIIHYSPQKDDCEVVKAEQIYLLDSGGQYRDGTTDTTRTMHFGTPTAEEKDAFTRVLKGHIALDMTVFPKGTTGYVLDSIARRSLWQVGLDYRHGTGHGVGSFLNVHEGPHGIGTRINLNDVGMVAGMTITNEPGYYADGKFGIRIENVLLVRDAGTPNNFGDRGYLGFEHVTMVPIQTKLMDAALLNAEEVALPSKSDMDRKKELYRFVVATRQQFTKILVIVRWCKKYSEPTNTLLDISKYLDTQSLLADWNTFILAEKEIQGRGMREPNYDLATAIEMLTKGTYARFPTVVQEEIRRFQPQVPSEEERRAALNLLEDTLSTMLAFSELVPSRLRKGYLGIEEGKAKFKVDGEFEVTLSVHPRDKHNTPIVGTGPALHTPPSESDQDRVVWGWRVLDVVLLVGRKGDATVWEDPHQKEERRQSAQARIDAAHALAQIMEDAQIAENEANLMDSDNASFVGSVTSSGAFRLPPAQQRQLQKLRLFQSSHPAFKVTSNPASPRRRTKWPLVELYDYLHTLALIQQVEILYSLSGKLTESLWLKESEVERAMDEWDNPVLRVRFWKSPAVGLGGNKRDDLPTGDRVARRRNVLEISIKIPNDEVVRPTTRARPRGKRRLVDESDLWDTDGEPTPATGPENLFGRDKPALVAEPKFLEEAEFELDAHVIRAMRPSIRTSLGIEAGLEQDCPSGPCTTRYDSFLSVRAYVTTFRGKQTSSLDDTTAADPSITSDFDVDSSNLSLESLITDAARGACKIFISRLRTLLEEAQFPVVLVGNMEALVVTYAHGKAVRISVDVGTGRVSVAPPSMSSTFTSGSRSSSRMATLTKVLNEASVSDLTIVEDGFKVLDDPIVVALHKLGCSALSSSVAFNYEAWLLSVRPINLTHTPYAEPDGPISDDVEFSFGERIDIYELEQVLLATKWHKDGEEDGDGVETEIIETQEDELNGSGKGSEHEKKRKRTTSESHDATAKRPRLGSHNDDSGIAVLETSHLVDILTANPGLVISAPELASILHAMETTHPTGLGTQYHAYVPSNGSLPLHILLCIERLCRRRIAFRELEAQLHKLRLRFSIYPPNFHDGASDSASFATVGAWNIKIEAEDLFKFLCTPEDASSHDLSDPHMPPQWGRSGERRLFGSQGPSVAVNSATLTSSDDDNLPLKALYVHTYSAVDASFAGNDQQNEMKVVASIRLRLGRLPPLSASSESESPIRSGVLMWQMDKIDDCIPWVLSNIANVAFIADLAAQWQRNISILSRNGFELTHYEVREVRFRYRGCDSDYRYTCTVKCNVYKEFVRADARSPKNISCELAFSVEEHANQTNPHAFIADQISSALNRSRNIVELAKYLRTTLSVFEVLANASAFVPGTQLAICSSFSVKPLTDKHVRLTAMAGDFAADVVILSERVGAVLDTAFGTPWTKAHPPQRPTSRLPNLRLIAETLLMSPDASTATSSSILPLPFGVVVPLSILPRTLKLLEKMFSALETVRHFQTSLTVQERLPSVRRSNGADSNILPSPSSSSDAIVTPENLKVVVKIDTLSLEFTGPVVSCGISLDSSSGMAWRAVFTAQGDEGQVAYLIAPVFTKYI
ncbi:hypothetical protein HDU93_007526 [Gonapodya sp. JEL0774]|nr:hypothetical protein HDU93_007526 [Gonapodya sp. JEL0774]